MGTAVALVKYDSMCLAIEQAVAVDEVKDIRDKAMAFQLYAKQAKNLDAERRAGEIRIRAERRCGGLLAEMPKAEGGRPTKTGNKVEPVSAPQTLSDLGITKKQSSEWQKLAEVPQEKFEEAIAELEVPTITGVFNHRAQGTGENEWYTPPAFIQAVRDVLGTIELDPASSRVANETVKAERYFTESDDSLGREWKASTLYMNPPYAQPWIAKFVKSLCFQVGAGNVKEAIALTHNYTDTAWFHEAEEVCNAICFTRGRIGFLSPDGVKASATQGQAFFYFGKNVKKFAERFQSIGFVVVPYEF